MLVLTHFATWLNMAHISPPPQFFPQNARNDARSTPLHMAVEAGKTGAVQALLSVGADPEVVNAKGNAALHVAAERGNRLICQALIDFGARVCDRKVCLL